MPTVLHEIVAWTDVTADRQVIDDQTGEPADITGLSFQFTLRSRPGDSGDPILSKTTAENGGITFPDPAIGKLQIAITATDTQGLSGLYVYELDRTDTGEREVLESGWLLIKRSITPRPAPEPEDL